MLSLTSVKLEGVWCALGGCEGGGAAAGGGEEGGVDCGHFDGRSLFWGSGLGYVERSGLDNMRGTMGG